MLGISLFWLVIIVIGILWICLYYVHYTYYVDNETKEKNGWYFAIMFFILFPYLMGKTIYLSRKNKKKN
jgi:RsiW-degrading membrane proteinase PrsW (M82 family)